MSRIKKSPKIEARIAAFNKHFNLAVLLHKEGKDDSVPNSIRKAVEAFLKIYILNKYGDELGEDIIEEKKTIDGLTLRPSKAQLSLNELRQICYDNKLLNKNAIYRTDDLKKKCNPPSHDIETEKTEQNRNNLICLAQCIELAKELYQDLGEDLPNNFLVDFGLAKDNDSINLCSDWTPFYDYIDYFSHNVKYALIAPCNYEDCSIKTLSCLSFLKWSIIIDFNPETKESGLFKSFPNIEDRAIPLMITQLKDTSVTSSANKGTINWIFANGISSVKDTITTDIKSWRSKKYQKLIGKVFSECNRQTLSRWQLICIETDPSYFEEIIRQIDESDTISNDMVKIAYCSNNVEKKSEASSILTKYDLDCEVFNISLTDFITGIVSVTNPIKESQSTASIPIRTQENEIVLKDASHLLLKLADAGIELIHTSISTNDSLSLEGLPSFYKGNTITWTELAADIDVSRKKFIEISNKIKNLLDTIKQSSKFEICHNPGAGGTTIARRLAYEFRTSFPTIVLNSFDRSHSFDKLISLADFVNRPIIAFVEASNVRITDIDDLRNRLNSAKKIILFVVIKRTLGKSKDTNNAHLSFLSDKIADNEEKYRFLSKVQAYCKDKALANELSNKSVSDSEVIDYALSLSTESVYNRERLIEYIKEYINQMPEEQVRFAAFVSLVYHYSQKTVSELLFRDLLKNDLNVYLRTHQEKYILKILIQEEEDGEPTYYWKPRFSIFAEIILQVILGNGKVDNTWKDQLPLYAKQLIAHIKTNNECLVDETRQLISSVFFDRGNEDVLGVESQWNSITTDLFSQLIRDLGSNIEEQKNILSLIANSFPEEPHYWAHLGRFVFETASCPEEYEEALSYIQKAFDAGGDSDPKIFHIAGMCLRRKIEYYQRNSIKIEFSDLKSITEDSKDYFLQSREKSSSNVYSYVSEIQLLVCVLEFGMSLSPQFDKFREFLLDPSNGWFLEQYETLNELIEEANIILQQIEQLGTTRKLIESKGKIQTAESRTLSFIGDYKTSLSFIEKLIDKAERDQRPRLRILYVRSLLLSKVEGNKQRYKEAWSLLSEFEEEKVNRLLTDNNMQNSSDVYSLLMWFNFVRNSHFKVSIEDVLSRLSKMMENSEDYSLSKGQASYYLYILKAIQLIQIGYPINATIIDDIKKLIDICRSCSSFDKFPYEWLFDLNGVKGLISHKDKTEKTKLIELTGTITNITTQQQGTIILDCGLNAFFVPAIGKFNKDTDITARVSFFLGFRHDGLLAYDVHREGESCKNSDIIIEEATPVENLSELDEEQKEEEELVSSDSSETDFLHFGMGIDIQKPKIVGKIDLDKINKKRR